MALSWLKTVGAGVIACLLLCGCSKPEKCDSSPPRPSPVHEEERPIKDMKVGDSGWTVPWAMYRDQNNNYWLRASYTCSRSPGGTVQMQVQRTADGYRVDISSGVGFRWDKDREEFREGDLPVVAITAADANGVVRIGKTLPAHHFQMQLRDLKVGQSAWTTPWALFRTADNRYLLNGSYAAHERRGGTVEMLVTRSADGYKVDMTSAPDYRWPKSSDAEFGPGSLEVIEIATKDKTGAVRRGPELPPDCFQKELRDLQPGEQAWTVPWALYAVSPGKYELSGSYAALEERGGTVQMLVIRTDDGWYVDISKVRSDETWSLRTGEPKALPVSRVMGGTITLR